MKCLYILTVFVINLVICSSFTLKSANLEIKHQNYKNGQRNINSETNNIIKDGPTRLHMKHRSFIPFARPSIREDPSNLTNTCPSSSDDFPHFLTRHQRNHGGVILCFLIGTYCFTLLAVVCNRYFLPCVETICDVLHLTPDVAAATFMSVATSCPELFTNIIGTFVTQSDIGIGTIVGSSLFNALGVASVGGIVAVTPLQLDWWPLTRDVCIYSTAVSLLVIFTWDEYIYWYEAVVLFAVYFLYFFVMFQNERISKFVKRKFGKHDEEVKDPNVQEKDTKLPDTTRVSIISAYGTYLEEAHKPGYDLQHQKTLMKLDEEDKKEAQKSLFRRPGGSLSRRVFFYYSWPIQFVLRYTIPNPKVHPKLFPMTFILCIIWIGTNSYMVSWMMTLIGNAFHIPDTVLGLTFLAAGGCLPESISMAIISSRGEGAFGVSNSLGANTMNILFSLGMPWFFKTITKGATSESYIKIQSGSIEYTILALIGAATILYLVLFFNKFRLGKRAGGILMGVYLCSVVLAILSEMVFFDNSCRS